jgi:Fe(3+) dicitrate transport protein
MKLARAGTPGSDSNRIESARALAAYAQVSRSFGRLSISPGVRTEVIRQRREDFGRNDPDRAGTDLSTRENRSRVLIPGIGLSFRLAQGTQAFAGLHRGFSPPGTTEGAKPERSVNAELGLRHTRGTTRFESVFFVSSYSNLLGSDLAASGGTGSTDLFNGGRARTTGLEVSGAANAGSLVDWSVSLPLRFSYTWTAATFASNFESTFEPWGVISSGDRLPYVPEHRAAAALGLDADRWSFEFSGAFTGMMRTRAGQGSAPAAERIESYLVLDDVAEYSVRRGVAMHLSVRNLTDAVYVVARRPAGLRPGLPRSVMLGVRASF